MYYCLHVFVCVYVIYIYIYMYACVHVCLFLFARKTNQHLRGKIEDDSLSTTSFFFALIYLYMYVYVYVCIYLFIYLFICIFFLFLPWYVSMIRILLYTSPQFLQDRVPPRSCRGKDTTRWNFMVKVWIRMETNRS